MNFHVLLRLSLSHDSTKYLVRGECRHRQLETMFVYISIVWLRGGDPPVEVETGGGESIPEYRLCARIRSFVLVHEALCSYTKNDQQCRTFEFETRKKTSCKMRLLVMTGVVNWCVSLYSTHTRYEIHALKTKLFFPGSP